MGHMESSPRLSEEEVSFYHTCGSTVGERPCLHHIWAMAITLFWLCQEVVALVLQWETGQRYHVEVTQTDACQAKVIKE